MTMSPAVTLAQGVINNCMLSGSLSSFDDVREPKVITEILRILGGKGHVPAKKRKEAARAALQKKVSQSRTVGDSPDSTTACRQSVNPGQSPAHKRRLKEKKEGLS